MIAEADTQPTPINKYQDRLEKFQKVTGYDDLSSESKQLIAHLAQDENLDYFQFNEAAMAELDSGRVNPAVVEVAASIALGDFVKNPEEASEKLPTLPKTFHEAQVMVGHTYEESLGRSDVSENNPDDIAFYNSDALKRHMERLHALSDKYRQYARGNATVEQRLAKRNDGGLWIEHSSLALVKEKDTADSPTARIYLNPRLQDSFDIYQEIFIEANRRGLRFQSKVFDPSWYGTHSIDKVVNSGLNSGKTVRRDPILFYGFEESKDELLSLVEDVYRKHSQSFDGRETGSIPLAIAPGLAVGDNVASRDSGGVRESLTSHRENVFNRMPANLTGQQRRQYLLDNHINPDNIAFND